MPKPSPTLIIETRPVGFGGSHLETRVRPLEPDEAMPDNARPAPEGAEPHDWRTD